MEREKKAKLKMMLLETTQICGLKACLGEEQKDSAQDVLGVKRKTSTLELNNEILQEVKQVQMPDFSFFHSYS